jgi:2-polyprenyl-3-methyl-5-hydroxy-6-metoxy-1,4-benzoquinol methylase
MRTFTSTTPSKTRASSSSEDQTYQTSSSIDPTEIRKFQAMADSWWIENGEFEALHRMNLLRVPLIRDTMSTYRQLHFKSDDTNYTKEQLVVEPLLGLKILDVGCGGGILSEVRL